MSALHQPFADIVDLRGLLFALADHRRAFFSIRRPLIVENENMTIAVEISFKILIYEIMDKFHMAPPICKSYQIVGQRFRASVEIQDNAVEGGKIKLYSYVHKRKLRLSKKLLKMQLST
ncbi:hypothetical protein RHSIM_Rhsim05G0111200 [Rhododendron simsii]|uniref:Uncharacterized protein n=1 Tax=Rhododendron simsii TaxID=118357 RepID=A0A834GZV2_RHOSS|nr:hypothetical protein RHSIM_Rhsim05G0111200 [Rhododendron simsii]